MAYIFEAAQRLPLSGPDSGRSALTEGAQLIDLRGVVDGDDLGAELEGGSCWRYLALADSR